MTAKPADSGPPVCVTFISSEGKKRGALTLPQLYRHLKEQADQILAEGDDPNAYVVEIREHYLVAPPKHCTRDREHKVVFLVGKF